MSEENIKLAAAAAIQMVCYSMTINGIMPVIQAYLQAAGNGKALYGVSLQRLFAAYIFTEGKAL